jgi:hypothetical protein
VSQGQYVAVAYGAAFVVVLVYVAIIAAKLVRLQRDLARALELVAGRQAATEQQAAGQPDAATLRS